MQAEGLVRNLGHFARFLEVMTFSHGGVLNLAHIARDTAVGRKTIEGYLDVLTDLLLCFRVPVFARRAKRQLITHEKFYYFDAGVFAALRPRGALDQPQVIAGAALEGLVAQHLRAWIAYRRPGAFQLYYWRTKSGAEVDFVVYGEDAFFALEVKHARHVYPIDTKHLRSFKEDYPEATVALLYLGDHRIEINGIPCLPVADFLQTLRPDRDPSFAGR